MIIQIMSNLFEEGYLRREKYNLLSPFFSNGNVAFRREALSQVAPYDGNCYSGEDQDMCFRMAKAGWELYFARDAIVRHKSRTTLRAFIRQWFNYGFHHPYLFKKHGFTGLRIYRPGNSSDGNAIYRDLLRMRLPFPILVFLTHFLVMNILLVLAIIFAAVGLFIPAIVVGVITFVVALSYFRSDIGVRNPFRTCAFVFFRYIVNLALLAGGLLGGVKRGMIYISATFDYKG
jgi:cellulose synthase/poly-beta-1,6-N-acetylglucosamine synthase-like glycosyltransferase